MSEVASGGGDSLKARGAGNTRRFLHGAADRCASPFDVRRRRTRRATRAGTPTPRRRLRRPSAVLVDVESMVGTAWRRGHVTGGRQVSLEDTLGQHRTDRIRSLRCIDSRCVVAPKNPVEGHKNSFSSRNVPGMFRESSWNRHGSFRKQVENVLQRGRKFEEQRNVSGTGAAQARNVPKKR